MLGHAGQLDWFKGEIEMKFEFKCSERIGPAENSEKEM